MRCAPGTVLVCARAACVVLRYVVRVSHYLVVAQRASFEVCLLWRGAVLLLLLLHEVNSAHGDVCGDVVHGTIYGRMYGRCAASVHARHCGAASVTPILLWFHRKYASGSPTAHIVGPCGLLLDCWHTEKHSHHRKYRHALSVLLQASLPLARRRTAAAGAEVQPGPQTPVICR